MSVSIDEPLTERAIYNLIHNSIAHNPVGCHIKVSAHRSGDMAMITIQDNGRGVSDEILKQISKIPKTTHGLGLPMAYKIISVHGGKFSTKKEGGFTVHIELPTV